MKPVEQVYNLNKCVKCGANDFKSTDNSIDKIKDKDGFADIYPVRLCQKCNTYHGVDCDDKGIYMFKLNRWQIRSLNCKNWNFK